MVDTDGSETATVNLTGFGVGNNVTFKAGGENHGATYNEDSDTYTIESIAHDQLGTLAFNSDYNINAEVTVTAHTVETANNAASESTDATFHAVVSGGEAFVWQAGWKMTPLFLTRMIPKPELTAVTGKIP